MKPKINFPGKIYGRLTLVRKDGKTKQGATKWLCACSCGNTKSISQCTLGRRAFSCGCLVRENIINRNTTHGHSKGGRPTTELCAWKNMISRCYNKNNARYADYGGRGISVCASWKNSFESFLLDVGVRPSKYHTLDRWPDNNGNYCPENFRWATRKEQAHNRRSNVLIKYRGQTKTLGQWCEKFNLFYPNVHIRIYQCRWSIAKSFTTPTIKKYIDYVNLVRKSKKHG